MAGDGPTIASPNKSTTDAVAWTPAAPGHFQLRVVDQAGRFDTREVDIEFAP